MNRRLFLASATVTGIYAAAPAVRSAPAMPSHRPPPSKRKFISTAVEQTIQKVSAQIADKELAWIFQNCYPNPLDTTVDFSMAAGKPDTFVITGDISAMWLRDTMHQMWPYLQLAAQDDHLKIMLQGVIHRMVRCVLISPYANAYLKTTHEKSIWHSDHTHMPAGVWEHKWEIDSLCSVIRMSYGYWQATGDITPFDAEWLKAMDRIVNTFHVQQRLDQNGPYRFQRHTWNSTDTLPRNGLGFPAKPIGLIYTMFRPSDDAVKYPLHIPDNFFAAVSLRQLSSLYHVLGVDADRCNACKQFADSLQTALKIHGIGQHEPSGRVYAYEIDGFGNAVFMDDANWPGILSLPYLDACPATDPIYQASRKLAWGSYNPYFYKGCFEGIGSIHTSDGNIWPMSLIMYGLTSNSPEEIAWVLKQLKSSSAGTGFIHESFDKNNPSHYTRSWFAMANAMFGELVVQTMQHHPQVLSRSL